MSSQRILRLLDARDATVAEIASSLDLATKTVADLLRKLRGEVHCIAGPLGTGTYRRGAAPADFAALDALEQSRRAILGAIAHDALSADEIAEATGLSCPYVRERLRGMGDAVTVIPGAGSAGRYGQHPARFIARDATPAPPRAPRIPLPLWAQALAR